MTTLSWRFCTVSRESKLSNLIEIQSDEGLKLERSAFFFYGD